MRYVFVSLTLVSFVCLMTVFAQDGFIPNPRGGSKENLLRGFQRIDANSAFSFSGQSLFKTVDDGEQWQEITPRLGLFDEVSAILFSDSTRGIVITANRQLLSIKVHRTTDAGANWADETVKIEDLDLIDADLGSIYIEPDFQNYGEFRVEIKLVSSSSFNRFAVLRSLEGGRIWRVESTSSVIRTFDEPPNTLNDALRDENFASEFINEGVLQESSISDGSKWFLTSEGICKKAKTQCEQITRIRKLTKPDSGRSEIIEITPELTKFAGELTFQSQITRPPNGSTRISLNRGFDKCTAAPTDQMRIWWDNSPFYDVNIYHSGRNRGCSQALLNAAWVDAVTQQGWGLIPTVVGYQSPCSVCANCAKHSTDPATAEMQGRGEADVAISDANNLGITQGAILYYDMERYDDVSGTGACSTPTKAFLKGWTDRIKELGYVSGVYGSPTNAQNDWINIQPESRMDAVWLARWNNVMSVWGVAPLSDAYWTDHQRIHQWLGPRNETWGGVTFNIDNNISDAPVVGLAVRRNVNADFDGDGKTDLSVFRPETGVWYVLNSSNSTVSYSAFGTASDIIAPGDYDGDGKTDNAVFRPSEGNWYQLTKAGFFSSTQFGAAGDIPAAADFNGDGKTDKAVFRPSNGVWYIANSDSRGTYTIVQFGMNGDKPVQSDFDGDGRADIAVFRPSTGVWYVLRSSDGGFSATQFGISGDRIAQGDYDGDGQADYGVFRDGVWYILQSGGETSIVNFGIAGDFPVTGDYDGDGRADISVFRPSGGIWYLLRSATGFSAAAFGVSTDRPVPTGYLSQ